MLITYLFKISIAVILCWSIYILFLRKVTFYNWNRGYLLLMPWILMGLTFLDTSIFFPVKEEYIGWVPVIYENGVVNDSWLKELSGQWLPIIFVTGSGLLIIRLAIKFYSLRKLYKTSSLLIDQGVKIVNTREPVNPFSFSNTIYLHLSSYSETELKEIILHEFVHIRQRHTVDMLAGEFFCILNWYNPFAWMLHSRMKDNLEFIADSQVIGSGIDPVQYQYMLLKVMGNRQYSAVNNFNAFSLKKRITMMNKTKSGRMQLLRFALVIPAAALLLVSFRNEPVQFANIVNSMVIQQKDTVPTASSTFTSIKLPKGVRNIRITGDIATVNLKNGKKEVYDFRVTEEKAAYVKKYGLPPVPPPPPPVPAAAPDPDGDISPVPPVAPSPPPVPAKSGKKSKPAPPPPPAPIPPPPPPVPDGEVKDL